MPKISWRKLSRVAENYEIREGFLPQKFPAIRYLVEECYYSSRDALHVITELGFATIIIILCVI